MDDGTSQQLREDIRELRAEVRALSDRFVTNYVHRDRLDSVALAWERALTSTELRWDTQHQALRDQLRQVGDAAEVGRVEVRREVDEVGERVGAVAGRIEWAARVVIGAVILAALAALGLTAR